MPEKPDDMMNTQLPIDVLYTGLRIAGGAVVVGVAFFVVHTVLAFILHILWPFIRGFAWLADRFFHLVGPLLDGTGNLLGGGERNFLLGCALWCLAVIIALGFLARWIISGSKSSLS